jgi:hypothetical protein
MLPFQFRQVILQRHVSSSYVISDPDIVASRVWRVEGKICKIESRRCFDDLALHRASEHTSAPLGPAPLRLGILEFLMTEFAEMEAELARLKQEHRDLDMAIDALESMVAGDQLQVQRLKKRKLALKDQIIRLEDQLTPDIIA